MAQEYELERAEHFEREARLARDYVRRNASTIDLLEAQQIIDYAKACEGKAQAELRS